MQSLAQLIVLLLGLTVEISSIPTREREWDHFVFAQQWPMTTCIDEKITHQHECSIPKNVTTWTTHGLWPSWKSTKGPEFCTPSASFDTDMLNPILPQLVQFWPNLFTDSEFFSFWKHEWCKHGTCAMTLPKLDSEVKYFKKGIELQHTFDILSILKQAGIVPRDDNTYQYQEVLNALTNGLGFTPSLQCFYDRDTKTQYVSQIEFCLSKSFQVIECPTSRSVDPNTLLFLSANRRMGYERSGAPESCENHTFSRRHHHYVPGGCRDTEPVAYPTIKNF